MRIWIGRDGGVAGYVSNEKSLLYVFVAKRELCTLPISRNGYVACQIQSDVLTTQES